MCRETASELLMRSDLLTRRAPASRAFSSVRSGLRAVCRAALKRETPDLMFSSASFCSRWEEASWLEEAARDLPAEDPEGLKGRDVADFALGIGGSAAIGACHAHFATIGTGIFAPTQPES